MATSFKVDGKPYAGIDIEGMASEEVFKAATRGLTAWKDNLTTGTGALGHRRPWVNTGEARADLTMTPESPGSLEYTVGGDVVQLWIAEFGRSPNNTMPPYDAIADWVAEKGIATRGSPGFDGVVFLVRRAIARDGIKPFAPGLKAGRDSIVGLEASVRGRIIDEHRRRDSDARQGFIP